MSRTAALARSQTYFDNGDFLRELTHRVAVKTESPDPDQRPELYRYLTDVLTSALEPMGFSCAVYDNSHPAGCPFLVAHRHEADGLPTVMSYGHGDVVLGYDEQWRDGLSPWQVVVEGDRWFGRGTADNKGQHTINLAALRHVLDERGSLGFNAVLLFETGEECGSPGLKDFCEANKDLFAADVFIASDGPRMQPGTPTVFMGSRGAFNFSMELTLREGGHHSGNWGGLLSNPGIIMAHALSTMVSSTGELLVDGWKAEPMSDSVRAAIAELSVGGDEDSPQIDPNWGEPGFTPEERVFGSNTFEILAFETGNPRNPVNAIPPSATTHCHLRFVAGTDADDLLPALRRHLDARGFESIELIAGGIAMNATRLDPAHPWAQWAIGSVAATSGKDVAVLPNLGGSLPNDVFADVLGLPTIWVPHSYPGCSQHAPNEHVLGSVCSEALQIMTGLWWDLGSGDTPGLR